MTTAERTLRTSKIWLNMRRKDIPRNIVVMILLLLTFYPFVLLLIISVKSYTQFEHHPWTITTPFFWENFTTAWSVIKIYVLNSLIVSSVSCAGVVLISAVSAYTFARYSFPGRELLFYLIISLMMIPGILILVPRFILIKTLGLLDTRWSLILPYIAGGQVFGIFLLRTFFGSIPEELFEAARIDGASEWQVFFKIAVPLSKSILGTLAIMNVLSTWNDLIWPMAVLSSDRVYTITIGLVYFRNEFFTNWGPLFAGYVIASVPLLVLFTFASKLFVKGLSSGALKI